MQLSRRTLMVGGVLSVVVFGVVSVSGQTKTLPTDHLTGTWKINVAKSKYSPADLAPKSSQSRVTVTQAGVKVGNDGVNAKGEATHYEYTAKFDGKDYPWTGTVAGKPNPDQDAVSWKQIDEWTYEITNKLKGKVTGVVHLAISHDGRSATATVTGTTPTGQAMNHTIAYEKQ